MSALVECCLLSCSLRDQVPRCLRGYLLWTKDLGNSDKTAYDIVFKKIPSP